MCCILNFSILIPTGEQKCSHITIFSFFIASLIAQFAEFENACRVQLLTNLLL